MLLNFRYDLQNPKLMDVSALASNGPYYAVYILLYIMRSVRTAVYRVQVITRRFIDLLIILRKCRCGVVIILCDVEEGLYWHNNRVVRGSPRHWPLLLFLVSYHDATYPDSSPQPTGPGLLTNAVSNDRDPQWY